MLTKGGDDTANTKDGHEAVRPKMWLVVEGKEEKEKESEGVSFRKELEGGNELEDKVIKIKIIAALPCNWKREQQRHDLHITHANPDCSICWLKSTSIRQRQ